MKKFFIGLSIIVAIAITILALSIAVHATDVVEIDDGCHFGTFSGVLVSFNNSVMPTPEGTLTILNNCTDTTLHWAEELNLTLGNITEGEVILGKDFVFVDSIARPDLDVPAHLIFRNVDFVIRPSVFVDGVLCTSACANETYNPTTGTFAVDVVGFSNYSLVGAQDFTLQSDPEPELYSRTYQTIDLGDSYRDDEFHCIVQLYGRNPDSQWILMQTNPERNVAARLWGSPDQNQPESLGYFRTSNGLANVYFDGSKVAGYEDYEYVAQCADNSTKLVYEESVSTRYRTAGRNLVGRFVWLSDGPNAFFIVIIIVIVFILLFLAVKFYRTLRR